MFIVPAARHPAMRAAAALAQPQTFTELARRLGLARLQGDGSLDPRIEMDWRAFVNPSSHDVRGWGERDGRIVELVHRIEYGPRDLTGQRPKLVRECRLSVATASTLRMEIVPRATAHAVRHCLDAVPTPSGEPAIDAAFELTGSDPRLAAALIAELAALPPMWIHVTIADGWVSLCEPPASAVVATFGELVLPILSRIAERAEALERGELDVTAPEAPAPPPAESVGARFAPSMSAEARIRAEPARTELGRVVHVLVPRAERVVMAVALAALPLAVLAMGGRESWASLPSDGSIARTGMVVATMLLIWATFVAEAVRLTSTRVVMREHGFEWHRGLGRVRVTRYRDVTKATLRAVPTSGPGTFPRTYSRHPALELWLDGECHTLRDLHDLVRLHDAVHRHGGGR